MMKLCLNLGKVTGYPIKKKNLGNKSRVIRNEIIVSKL